MYNLSGEEKEQLRQLINSKSERNVTDAAEILHRHYHKLIHYFLRIFDLPDDDREDVFNQVFIKVLRGLPGIKHYNNLKSWIVTITKNEIYTHLSKKEKQHVVYTPYLDQVERLKKDGTTGDDIKSPERTIYNEQIRTAIDGCLKNLKRDFREPFLLRYRDHLSWREIAGILDINEDTARKRSDKAKREITKMLKLRFGINRN